MNQRVFSRGFTLLELLVAITVLSIVSMIAWRGLDSLVSTRERLEPEVDDMRSLLTTFGQMERDLTQVTNPAFLGLADVAAEHRRRRRRTGDRAGARCESGRRPRDRSTDGVLPRRRRLAGAAGDASAACVRPGECRELRNRASDEQRAVDERACMAGSERLGIAVSPPKVAARSHQQARRLQASR